MAEQPNPAVEFLETCIDQLETQASRIGKAVGTLRALQVTARDVDHEHIQAMARAVLEQVYNADSRFVHGPRHYSGLRQPSATDEDESIPFDPERPPRKATTQEEEVFERAVKGFLKYRNMGMSFSTVRTITTADPALLVNVICSAFPHRFERFRGKSGHIRWRLRPEYVAELERENSQPSAPPASHAGQPEATISMGLGPPPATQMTQTEAAAEVLRGAGRPLSTGDIVNWMIRLGFYPADNIRDLKQFNNSVFSAMSRKAEKGEVFRKVAPGTWGLLEWETERKEGAEE